MNRADPSGHMSWQAVSGIVAGVIGLALVPFTLGQSLSVTACVMAVAESVSGVTAITASALQDKYPRRAAVLGWVSLATGLLSLGKGVLTSGLRLANQVRNATDTMVMDLEGEFSFLSTLGRTLRRGANQDAMMSVVFEDRVESAAHQSFRRLNVWAHGRAPDRIYLTGHALTAEMVVLRLRANGINVSDYDAVRFIACNSVNLAHSFTEFTNITATGFRGNVTVGGHTVAAMRVLSAEVAHLEAAEASMQFMQAASQYAEKAIIAGVDIYDDLAFFRIVQGDPISFRNLTDIENVQELFEGYPPPEWYGSNQPV